MLDNLSQTNTDESIRYQMRSYQTQVLCIHNYLRQHLEKRLCNTIRFVLLVRDLLIDMLDMFQCCCIYTDESIRYQILNYQTQGLCNYSYLRQHLQKKLCNTIEKLVLG